MTPEELERLAREAGLIQPTYPNPNPYAGMSQTTMAKRIARFAALVLEAAAQACDRRVMGDLNREDMEARACAAAIRALVAPQSPAADQSAP